MTVINGGHGQLMITSVWNSLPADLRLEPDTANLKVTCFVLFLLSNFLHF